jgi:hypothetical protein
MATLRAEIERTGRADLKSALSWIAGQVAEVGHFHAAAGGLR